MKTYTENLIDAKNKFQSANLEVKIATSEEEFGQAKQLLIDLSSIKNRPKQINESAGQNINDTNLLYDGYDSYARHLIIKDSKSNKVVAYVRIIDVQTAYNIGGFFCESQFNLDKLRVHMSSAMELSHLVIDPRYVFQTTLELLWSGLKAYAEKYEIDTIFGTISLSIENSHYSATREINYLKSKYLSANNYRVKPYQILPPTRAIAGQNFELPAIVNFLFDQGAKLCGDASWNNILNHAELFFYIKLNANKQLMQYMLQAEMDPTGLVA